MNILSTFVAVLTILFTYLYSKKIYLHYVSIREDEGRPIEEGETAINTLYYSESYYIPIVANILLLPGKNKIEKKVNAYVKLLWLVLLTDIIALLIVLLLK